MNSLCLRTTSSLRVETIFGVVVMSRSLSCLELVCGVRGFVACFVAGMGSGDFAVRLWAPVAEELPGLADGFDFLQVEIRNQHLVLIAAGLRDNLAARAAKVALSVKFSDIPRGFFTHSVDCAHEITVRRRVRRL